MRAVTLSIRKEFGLRKEQSQSGQQQPTRYNFSLYRVLVVVLLLVLIGLQYRLWIADGSMAQVHRLQQEKQALQATIDQAKTRNKALAAEIEDLKSGKEAMAGRARSDIGMTKEGETFYFTVESSDRGNGQRSDAPPDGQDDGQSPANE